MDMSCKVPWVMFMNGERAPYLGLGTYEPVSTGKIRQAVIDAIDAGYRHFDCALIYKNENEVGDGICAKIIDGTIHRENIFVTSKLWNTYHAPDFVEDAYNLSIADIKLTYVDLYLMNWPMAYAHCRGLQPMDKQGKLIYGDVPFTDTWKAMEKMVDKNMVKSIGISNFNCNQVIKLLKCARIKPVVNQIESHPYLPQKELKSLCESYGILVEAYAPLGSSIENEYRDDEPVLLEDPDVKSIADKHGKTPANVLIKFQIQRGAIPLPKSINKDHIICNINVWDFALDKEDMAKLESLGERNIRYNSYYWVQDHPDYPFADKF